MRILLACEFYDPSIGGVQEVTRQLAERLVERGHRVTVATTHLAARRAGDINGVKIAQFAVSGGLVSGLTGEVDAYRAYVVNGDFDVLMINAAQQWTLDALAPVLDQIRRPKVLIPCGFSRLHDPAFADYYRRMPEMLRKFDHLIFNASDYRDINFARDQGITNFTILPNGASEREFQVASDPRFRARYAIPEDAFVLLTVGSLTEHKGHREVAAAFAAARFAGKPAALILNGNAPATVRLKDRMVRVPQVLINQYRARGLVRAVGWVARSLLARALPNRPSPQRDSRVPLKTLVERINDARPERRAMIVDLRRTELVQAYLNSDLFVFASNIEYSPLVLYEAAAAGLPFLSAPVGNAEEIARWTGGGETFPAPRDALGYTRADPFVLAERITALASNPDKLRTYSEIGRKNWLERFTWEKITDRYEEIFARLVSQVGGDVAPHTPPVSE